VQNRPELFAVVAAAASLLPRGPDRDTHVARPSLFAAAAAAARTWSCPGPGLFTIAVGDGAGHLGASGEE
jgi:hypothetical protein